MHERSTLVRNPFKCQGIAGQQCTEALLGSRYTPRRIARIVCRKVFSAVYNFAIQFRCCLSFPVRKGKKQALSPSLYCSCGRKWRKPGCWWVPSPQQRVLRIITTPSPWQDRQLPGSRPQQREPQSSALPPPPSVQWPSPHPELGSPEDRTPPSSGHPTALGRAPCPSRGAGVAPEEEGGPPSTGFRGHTLACHPRLPNQVTPLHRALVPQNSRGRDTFLTKSGPSLCRLLLCSPFSAAPAYEGVLTAIGVCFAGSINFQRV